MTEYQKALRKAAYKRNRAKHKKHISDHKLVLDVGGIMRMRKDVKAQRKKDEYNKKRNKTHKTNPKQFIDDTQPATICGEMFSHSMNRTSINGDVDCQKCVFILKKNWYGQAE